MALGKNTRTFRRTDSLTDKGLILGQKTVAFYHQFSSAAQTDIDLTALSMPASLIAVGKQNPSASQIQSLRLSTVGEGLVLISSLNGILVQGISYDIISDTRIRLKNGAESQINEIIVGVAAPVNFNAVAIDAKAIVQTGTIAVGQTDVLVGEPFTYNKYSGAQAGDVLLFLDGLLQMRNTPNQSGGSGNFYEVAPSAGSLSTILRLNTPVSGLPKNYVVISNGLVAERPSAAVLSRIETLNGQMDKVIQDLAVVTGNPTSSYQSAPNSVDLLMFKNQVDSYITGVHYDAVVGSAAQVAARQATHTSIQAAINAFPAGQILVLAGTYTENLSISNPNLVLEGKGRASVVNGTVSMSSGAVGCLITKLKVSNNISIAAGANNNFVKEIWQAAGFSVTNSGTANSILVSQE